MLQGILKRSSSNHQAIIQLQKRIPELCSKQLLVFLFDIHNNMFPDIVKKILLKKIENCKCYKGYSSDHQAIIKRSSNYKSEFPNFAQNNFCFLFEIHNNMFLNIVKNVFFEKNWKIVNVTSDHQAIINNNIIQCTSPMHITNAQKPNF